jgi:cyclopropane-fatty-acyl-phospholipid synthase
MLQSLLEKKFLNTLEKIEYGSVEIVTPEGRCYCFEGTKPGAHAHLQLLSWNVLINLSLRGDIGFAEDYRNGLWHSYDLTGLFQVVFQNEAALGPYIQGGKIAQFVARLTRMFDANTLRGSRRNIAAHYDLGNEFYSLWLDPSMTYSAALFADKSEGLETAQNRKYDRILDRFGQRPGDIIEVGCGWGGFAQRAAEQDHRVKGITLSKEQHSYAQKRVKQQADIVLEDYRKQQGKFDYIVSIEMFEAVGERFWQTYFSKLGSLMKRGGKAVIQTITIDESLFEQYRKSGDMIRSFIFPGGMLPSPARFEQEVAKSGLKMTDRFAFGADYGLTMRHWLASFEAARDKVAELGFDEGFIRVWRFYLASCIACFESGRINVMQMELQHA